MKNDIIKDFLDEINLKQFLKFDFKEVCGFTFVIMTRTITFRDEIASAEIQPVAIIYEENGEYLLAPLDTITQIDEIVKEFVKNCL